MNEWILEKIELEYQRYGKNKNEYEGRITFQNGEYESFRFRIRPEMAQAYIDLISVEVVKCATELGEKLAKSLVKK